MNSRFVVWEEVFLVDRSHGLAVGCQLTPPKRITNILANRLGGSCDRPDHLALSHPAEAGFDQPALLVTGGRLRCTVLRISFLRAGTVPTDDYLCQSSALPVSFPTGITSLFHFVAD